MADQHTAKAFDVDLQDLARMVAEMGGLAEKQIAESVDALARRDAKLAQRVVALDPTIDALQREIEERAILTIARRQPMAVDLREIVGALRVSNDLERIGDLAKNIAKRVIALGAATYPTQVIRGVEHMSDLVLGQLKQVLDAYARRDVGKAMEVWRGDEEIDAVNNSLFRELLTYMMEDPRNITFCTHLLFCAKNIERMGDHATNIAETVYYIVEGRALIDERPKGDTTSTVAPFRIRRPSSLIRRQRAAMSARILIIEDEEPLTLLLRYNLEAEGYEVETSARGDEAEIKLKESPPDLLVLDWMLPGMSGIELCRRLRARPDTERLPIIMLTARGEESERVRGLATGADDYIVKPFSVPELLARIRSLLRRARPERVASVLGAGDLELDREKKRVLALRPRGASRADRVPPARVPDAEPGPRLHPRAAARRRVGPRHLYRRAHGRRACRPAAPRAQSRPRLRSDPHRARRRLFVRRAVRQKRVSAPRRLLVTSPGQIPGVHPCAC